MNKNSVVLLLSASLLTSDAIAGTMKPVTQQTDWAWVDTLSVSPVWEKGDTT